MHTRCTSDIISITKFTFVVKYHYEKLKIDKQTKPQQLHMNNYFDLLKIENESVRNKCIPSQTNNKRISENLSMVNMKMESGYYLIQQLRLVRDIERVGALQ